MEISLEQYNMMAERLTELEYLLAERHWIPCGERLPEKEGIYIVTDDAGGMATVSTDEFSHYEDGEQMWMFSQNVTAWMPLPERYQEGEQDG